MIKHADDWIRALGLIEHPEGGYFKETYRSQEMIDKNGLPERFSGQRSIATAIYFLLKGDQISHLHRIQSDEIWHFYTGTSLILHIINPDGEYTGVRLGADIKKGEVFQAIVKHGAWFGAEVVSQEAYALVGCTVAPGFDFQDFEMGNQEELLEMYPEHALIIKKLTK